ncbi:MAG: sn-glycerol-3-phosphate ABC transporter ATP-binding protein UgpC [Granulosicoccus sp.]|nr:sn-glycerol-3-phosphate ABC transporter ATP-binding protein UgpC [Granulosicoccus sp.]
MSTIRLEKLEKTFGTVSVIKGIDLEIESGEFCVFVGPSGCGKSTLLRMIAGLEDVSNGSIYIGDDHVNDMAPKDRGISMVFQSYALFPHKTVYENIAYGLRISKEPKAIIDQKVREASAVLKLDQLLDRKPSKLSGGQRQRVAIGRSIVRNPRVFLFDEPLSNLDAALRVSMRTEIAQLHNRLDATMVYVTHDQVEAMTLADKIVVLRDGIVEQTGSPMDLYNRPQNTFVAQFIGSPSMNLFDKADLSPMAPTSIANQNFIVGIRPEHMQVSSKGTELIEATLELYENLGEFVLAHFKTNIGTVFIAKLDETPPVNVGETMYFSANMEKVHLFDKLTEQRIAD